MRTGRSRQCHEQERQVEDPAQSCQEHLGDLANQTDHDLRRGSLSPDELGEFTPTILDQYMALYQGLVDDAETARDRAREWAEKTEGEAVEPGLYSAKHYVAKAKEWSEKAENDPVESGLYSAKHHAAKAKEWSEKAEDEPVEPGFYSAKHHAAKSAEHATLIYDHLAAVMPHQIVDHDNLVTYRYGFKIQNGDLVLLSEEVV